MARYGNEFKARAVARLLPPESVSIPRLSQEIGVSTYDVASDNLIRR